MKDVKAGEIVKAQLYTLDEAGKKLAGAITWKAAKREHGERTLTEYELVSFKQAR